MLISSAPFEPFATSLMQIAAGVNTFSLRLLSAPSLLLFLSFSGVLVADVFIGMGFDTRIMLNSFILWILSNMDTCKWFRTL